MTDGDVLVLEEELVGTVGCCSTTVLSDSVRMGESCRSCDARVGVNGLVEVSAVSCRLLGLGVMWRIMVCGVTWFGGRGASG